MRYGEIVVSRNFQVNFGFHILASISWLPYLGFHYFPGRSEDDDTFNSIYKIFTQEAVSQFIKHEAVEDWNPLQPAPKPSESLPPIFLFPLAFTNSSQRKYLKDKFISSWTIECKELFCIYESARLKESSLTWPPKREDLPLLAHYQAAKNISSPIPSENYAHIYNEELRKLEIDFCGAIVYLHLEKQLDPIFTRVNLGKSEDTRELKYLKNQTNFANINVLIHESGHGTFALGKTSSAIEGGWGMSAEKAAEILVRNDLPSNMDLYLPVCYVVDKIVPENLQDIPPNHYLPTPYLPDYPFNMEESYAIQLFRALDKQFKEKQVKNGELALGFEGTITGGSGICLMGLKDGDSTPYQALPKNGSDSTDLTLTPANTIMHTFTKNDRELYDLNREANEKMKRIEYLKKSLHKNCEEIMITAELVIHMSPSCVEDAKARVANLNTLYKKLSEEILQN